MDDKMKSRLAQALAAAMVASGKKTGAIEIDKKTGATSVLDLEDIIDEMGIGNDIFSEDDKPKDDTPVSPDMIRGGLALIQGLANADSPKEAYVEAFGNILLVHSEIHDAPVYRTKLHGYVLDVGNAIEAMGNMRFGKKDFRDAVVAYQEDHINRVKATLTEDILNNAGDFFKSLRPKARAN